MRLSPMRALAILLLAVAWLLPASAARAQMLPGFNMLQQEKPKTQDEVDRERETDSAYREAQKKIPNQQQSSDPWGTIREPAKPAAPAKKQAGAKQ